MPPNLNLAVNFCRDRDIPFHVSKTFVPAEGRITDWLRTIRMESCNILSSFFPTQEVDFGTCFRPSDGPEKIFWVLWVHGQHSKTCHATDLEDLALHPLAQTA